MMSRIEDLLASVKTDASVRSALSDAVALEFRNELREHEGEGELVAIDYMNSFVNGAGTCSTHDYRDANIDMDAAFRRVIARTADVLVANVDMGDLMHRFPVMTDVWSTAWDEAATKGFSTLWEHRESISDEAEFKALATVLLVFPDVNALVERQYPCISIDVDDEQAFDQASEKACRAISENPQGLAELASSVKAGMDSNDEVAVRAALIAFAEAHATPAPR